MKEPNALGGAESLNRDVIGFDDSIILNSPFNGEYRVERYINKFSALFLVDQSACY